MFLQILFAMKCLVAKTAIEEKRRRNSLLLNFNVQSNRIWLEVRDKVHFCDVFCVLRNLEPIKRAIHSKPIHRLALNYDSRNLTRFDTKSDSYFKSVLTRILFSFKFKAFRHNARPIYYLHQRWYRLMVLPQHKGVLRAARQRSNS